MKRGLVLLLVLSGCSDNNLAEVQLDAIAVVLGDFDNMRDTLTGLEIASTPFDGFIVQATYEPAGERTQRGDLALAVESLLIDEEGTLALDEYQAVFVNSGTRGLNASVYSDTLEPDDAILQNPDALQHVCDFAADGGALLVSDWAWELVEFCWPDAIDFYGEDSETDAAQVGAADGNVVGTVAPEALQELLGPVVNITYNYSAWSVIESVDAGSEVILAGDIVYQPSATELYDTLSDVPLMVRIPVGRAGQVVFTTFHWNAQNPAVARELLLYAVQGLDPGVAGTVAEAESAS